MMKEDTGSEMEKEEDTGSMLRVRTKRRDKRSIRGAMSKANKADYCVYTLAETSMMMPKVVAILDAKKNNTTLSSTSRWLL